LFVPWEALLATRVVAIFSSRGADPLAGSIRGISRCIEAAQEAEKLLRLGKIFPRTEIIIAACGRLLICLASLASGIAV
jgi:hypothetical protein